MNYVLYGEETYVLQETLRKLVHNTSSNDDDLNTMRLDALKNSVEQLLEDAQTVPFFADKKTIVVENANFLCANDDTGWDTASLETYLDRPMESTDLIFVGSFEKMDARKKIVKKIQKTCKVLVFHHLDAFEKKRYVEEQIKKRGIVLDDFTMEVLLSRLDCDIRRIRNELTKLELYGDGINEEVVRSLITRPLEENVFELVNAVVDQRIHDAFLIWEDMCAQNKDVIYFIAMLSSQFRFLFQVKELMQQGHSKAEITSILAAHPYRVQVSMRSVQSMHKESLLSILDRLATLDQMIKSGRIQKTIGFEMFLLRLQGV